MCFASCVVNEKKLLAKYRVFKNFCWMLFFEEFNYLNNMLENWYVPTRVSIEEPGFDHIVIKPDYTLFKEP